MLAAGSHTDREMEKLVEAAGADLELLLKTAVYEGSGRRRSLAHCISGLGAFGVGQAEIDALERLRLAYNRAKHEPATKLTFEDAHKLLGDAADAVIAVQGAGAGGIARAEPAQAVRQFWMIAGDHLIGGETEIGICLPTPDVDFPPGLDTVNIEMADWPRVRQDLADAGSLKEGVGSVPDRVFDAWSREDDIVMIGSWTGRYRALLRSLLPYEKVLDVLPGLARGDGFMEALSAMLMAAVDLAPERLLNGDERAARAALMAEAETTYSIPSSKSAAIRAADVTMRAVAALSDDQRAELAGPDWRSRADLTAARPSARAVDRDGLFLVTAEGRLLAWSGHQ